MSSDSEDDDVPPLVADDVEYTDMHMHFLEVADHWLRHTGGQRHRYINTTLVECLAPWLYPTSLHRMDSHMRKMFNAYKITVPDGEVDTDAPLTNEHFLAMDIVEEAHRLVTSYIFQRDVLATLMAAVHGLYCKPNNHMIMHELRKKVDQVQEWSFFMARNMKLHQETALQAINWATMQYVTQVYQFDAQRYDLADDLDVRRKTWSAQSEECKKSGNDAYKAQKYIDAVYNYTVAIQQQPFSHILYGNRAQAHIQAKNYRRALGDGKRCIILEPDWPKGYKRYAEALLNLNDLDKARDINEKGLQLCRNNETYVQLVDQFEEQKDKIRGLIQQRAAVRAKVEKLKGTQEAKDSSKKSKTGDSQKMQDTQDDKKEKSTDWDIEPGLISDSESDEEFKAIEAQFTELNERDEVERQKQEDQIIQEEREKSKRLQIEAERQKKMHQEKIQKIQEERERENEEKERKRQENIKTKNAKQATLEKGEAQKLADKSQVDKELGQASNALIQKEWIQSVKSYLAAIGLIQKFTKKYLGYGDDYIVLVRFSLGRALLGTDTTKYVDEALHEFLWVEEQNIYFPMIYLGLGQAYYKLNRFDDAMDQLQHGVKELSQKSKYKELKWPGTATVIPESQPGKLIKLLKFWLKLCHYPPEPDAMCRHDNTGPNHKIQIYYTDQDFQGFVRLRCSSNCAIDFHPTCWKKFKSPTTGKLQDKDILSTDCLTPDCNAFICKITTYDERGDMAREDHTNVEPQPKEKKLKVKMLPSSHKKIARRQEKKENRKQRREEDRKAAALNAEKMKDEDGVDIVEQLENKADDGNDDEIPTALLSSAVTVLKKEEGDDMYKMRGSTVKTTKKKKVPTATLR